MDLVLTQGVLCTGKRKIREERVATITAPFKGGWVGSFDQR